MGSLKTMINLLRSLTRKIYMITHAWNQISCTDLHDLLVDVKYIIRFIIHKSIY